MNKVDLFDISIDNLKMYEVISKINDMLHSNEKGYVVTPNVDHIVRLKNDSEFKKVYQNATLVLADGMPIVWSSILLGKRIVEKVSGSDLMPELCKYAGMNKRKIFILGAAPGVAAKAAENIKLKYENIIIDTYSPSYGFEKNKEENEYIINIINKANPDFLFVGVGAPKQEKWIYNNLDKLNVKVCLGIGASIDFIAGNVIRAPKWMQNCGMEWFYRFLQEPKRMFKRYFIDDLAFISIMGNEFLKSFQGRAK